MRKPQRPRAHVRGGPGAGSRAPERARAPEQQSRDATEIVYGLRACLAVVDRRPESLVRAGHSREVRGEIGELVRVAAARGIPCDELSEAELARIAGSSHHEGLCLATRPRKWTAAAALADLLVSSKGTAVALDRVRNAYNIGAILRSAAFFGVDAALLGAPAPHPALAPDAIRVAEGGVEHLALARTTDLAETLSRLRARGVRTYGAEGTAELSAIGHRFDRPAIVVLGHEREGLSERVRAQCDALISIPGTGAIESLNVGVAASLLLSEMMRPALVRSR